MPARSPSSRRSSTTWPSATRRVRLDDVVAGAWPDDACLLTFDDGLVEHLDVVAPALERRGLTGVFCPPGARCSSAARSTCSRRSSCSPRRRTTRRSATDPRAWPTTRSGSGRRTRRRTATTRRRRCSSSARSRTACPDGQREELLDDALPRARDRRRARRSRTRSTSRSTAAASSSRRGHEVIGHGWEHRRLGLLDEAAQRVELERTRGFVEDVGGTWALCYPYGSRNETTLRLLRELGCAAAPHDRAAPRNAGRPAARAAADRHERPYSSR